MASMKEITCKCGCGRKKMVRTADIKRGWGKYYSKSCKAKAQERKTGQYRDFLNRESHGSGGQEHCEQFSNEDYFDGYGFGAKD
ncbi:hypothetical protein KAR91_32835 [Candidatus Pacearchaeota archaeon]|nr:hypothetical protein [Candidatus Pacearchaeota archaeon]